MHLVYHRLSMSVRGLRLRWGIRCEVLSPGDKGFPDDAYKDGSELPAKLDRSDMSEKIASFSLSTHPILE